MGGPGPGLLRWPTPTRPTCGPASRASARATRRSTASPARATPAWTAALDDASAEIDSIIHDLYPLPLPAGPWPLLRSISCDLARLRLYDDEAPHRVLGAASSARKRLRMLAAGETALVDEGGQRAPRRPLVQATAPDPVMTREALRDA